MRQIKGGGGVKPIPRVRTCSGDKFPILVETKGEKNPIKRLFMKKCEGMNVDLTYKNLDLTNNVRPGILNTRRNSVGNWKGKMPLELKLEPPDPPDPRYSDISLNSPCNKVRRSKSVNEMIKIYKSQ